MKRKGAILKVAKDFSINFEGATVPKGAIYGKTRKFAFYIVDFEEYRKTMKLRTIYVMSYDVDNTFKKCVYSNETIVATIRKFISENELWGTKCENVLCLRRGGGQPRKKEAQVFSESIWKIPNVGYALSKHTITDKDPVAPIRRYV